MTDYIENEFKKIRHELRRNEYEVQRLCSLLKIIRTILEDRDRPDDLALLKITLMALRVSPGEVSYDNKEVPRGMLEKKETP